MKSLLPVAAALVFTCLARSAEAPDPRLHSPASTISAVTVYTDRAIVTRSAALELPEGQSEILFEQLPQSLLDQSLHVSGQGSAGATILDVTARETFVDFTPNERIKAIDDQLLELLQQVRVVDDRAATLKEQRDFVQRMLVAATGPAGSGSAASRPGLEEWQRLYSYSDETFGRIAAEQRSLDIQRAELANRRAALDRQLGVLRGGGGRSFKTVVVRVSAAYAGKLDLKLAYTVPGAGWTPAYDARLYSDRRVIELAYHGVVRQNTGEDWTDVAVTLSTAQPSLGGRAPRLSSWIVDFQRRAATGFATSSVGTGSRLAVDLKDTPAAYSVINRNFIDAMGITAVSEAATWGPGTTSRGPAPEPRAQAASAAVEAAVTSATFRIAAPTSVASDGSARKVSIQTLRLPADLHYEATPKLREAAFLAAKVKNGSEYPLMRGAMNTFLDDVFVAVSALQTVMPGESFELALGADEGISVKRRVVNRFTEDTGLSNRNHRLTYEFLVTVVNNKKTAESLAIREPLPVSRDEKIVVRLLSPQERELGTPDRPREVSREEDKLVWKLELKPDEKREIPLKVSVEHPADLAMVGLE